MTFNGSLLKENVFRQEAGPEVDAAWESLGVGCAYSNPAPPNHRDTNISEDRSLAVPLSEAAESGFKPDQVKINQKYGGGFPANVEGLHHLHCLVSTPVLAKLLFPSLTYQNLVRQSLYYNYDYYHSRGEGAFKNDDNIVRHHVCKYC